MRRRPGQDQLAWDIRDRGHQEDSTTFGVLPSQGLRGQGCESTRNLDQMLDVSDQVDLCPLQQGQSSSGCPHDQVSDGGDLCVSKPAPSTPGASSGYLPPPMMTSETSPPPDLMPDIQRALQGQTQQLAQSTAAVMSQVMSPVIEGFHQALRCQVEEQQRAQERQDAQMQQLFLAQQRIMQQNDMTRQQGACFPALSPEEIQRLLAQGFADTRRYMQQQGINEDEDWDAIPESPPGQN